MMFLAKPNYFKPIFFIIRKMMRFGFWISTYFTRQSFKSFISYGITHGVTSFVFMWVFLTPSYPSISSNFFASFGHCPFSISFLPFIALSICCTACIKACFTSRKWNIESFIPVKFREWFKNFTCSTDTFFFCIIKFLHIMNCIVNKMFSKPL